MCGFASFDGVPSCANKRLLGDILRDEWGSDAVVQSDCCDSLTSIKSSHNYTSTFEQAVAAGVDAGLQLCFGCDPNTGHKATQ
jgi:beta-glucosidase-like glycosyl hydrolase